MDDIDIIIPPIEIKEIISKTVWFLFKKGIDFEEKLKEHERNNNKLVRNNPERMKKGNEFYNFKNRSISNNSNKSKFQSRSRSRNRNRIRKRSREIRNRRSIETSNHNSHYDEKGKYYDNEIREKFRFEKNEKKGNYEKYHIKNKYCNRDESKGKFYKNSYKKRYSNEREKSVTSIKSKKIKICLDKVKSKISEIIDIKHKNEEEEVKLTIENQEKLKLFKDKIKKISIKVKENDETTQNNNSDLKTEEKDSKVEEFDKKIENSNQKLDKNEVKKKNIYKPFFMPNNPLSRLYYANSVPFNYYDSFYPYFPN